ncbi:MAG: CZB domain-containing protein [Bryobacteraceae bacterium]
MDATEITKGIAAHARWKARLNTAIDTRKLSVPVSTIRVDNECEFGKWLHGAAFPPAERNGQHYPKVKELHARFHQSAATVAQLAEAGRADEARKHMATNGDFALVSTELTMAMSAWRNTLA